MRPQWHKVNCLLFLCLGLPRNLIISMLKIKTHGNRDIMTMISIGIRKTMGQSSFTFAEKVPVMLLKTIPLQLSLLKKQTED